MVILMVLLYNLQIIFIYSHNLCRVYAEAHNIVFNASNTKIIYAFDKSHSTLFDKYVQLIWNPVCLLINVHL